MTELEARKVFGKNLSNILYEKRVTQRQLSQYMGVSSATTSDWCRGKKMPRIDKLTSIANYLGVKMSDLVEPTQYEESAPNREIEKIKQDMYESPSMRTVYSIQKNMPPEEFDKWIQMLQIMKGDTNE